MIVQSTLDNGIRVVTEPVAGARSVSIGVIIEASPQDEPPEKSGLAHLTEHAMFAGTQLRDSRSIARMIDQAGGQMGGFTSRDYTCYYANVLDDYCTYAMDLLGDILLSSTFPEQNIEQEKQAILRELGSAEDDPIGKLHDFLKRSIWREHPLGRSITGSQQSVQSLRRSDVVSFVADQYVPNNLIVAAAGAVDHQHFLNQAQDAFWSCEGNRNPRTLERCEFHPSVKVLPRQLTQSYFVLCLDARPFADEDRFAIHGLNCILGGGMSSRLFRQLRDDDGLVYHIGSSYQAYRDAGLIVIEGSTAPDQIMPVLARILIELARLASGDLPVEEEELWKAKMQLTGQLILAGDNIHTRMSRLANQELYFGEIIGEDTLCEQIEQIDCATISTLADEVLDFTNGGLSLGVIGPDLDAHTQEQIQALLSDFSVTH